MSTQELFRAILNLELQKLGVEETLAQKHHRMMKALAKSYPGMNETTRLMLVFYGYVQSITPIFVEDENYQDDYDETEIPANEGFKYASEFERECAELEQKFMTLLLAYQEKIKAGTPQEQGSYENLLEKLKFRGLKGNQNANQ